MSSPTAKSEPRKICVRLGDSSNFTWMSCEELLAYQKNPNAGKAVKQDMGESDLTESTELEGAESEAQLASEMAVKLASQKRPETGAEHGSGHSPATSDLDLKYTSAFAKKRRRQLSQKAKPNERSRRAREAALDRWAKWRALDTPETIRARSEAAKVMGRLGGLAKGRNKSKRREGKPVPRGRSKRHPGVGLPFAHVHGEAGQQPQPQPIKTEVVQTSSADSPGVELPNSSAYDWTEEEPEVESRVVKAPVLLTTEEKKQVEKIIGTMKIERKIWYLAKWCNLDESQNSWEEGSVLTRTAQKAINDFAHKFGQATASNPKILSPDGEAWEISFSSSD